jgi:hypothetical protein
MRRPILLFTFIACCGAVRSETNSRDVIEASDGQRYSRSAYDAGRSLAQEDIREGRLIIEVSGGPGSPTYDELKNALAERYNIQLKEIAGCIVDDQIRGHERGYNEISRAEITRRFGRDVAQETRDEVSRAAEQRVIEQNRAK